MQFKLFLYSEFLNVYHCLVLAFVITTFQLIEAQGDDTICLDDQYRRSFIPHTLMTVN